MFCSARRNMHARTHVQPRIQTLSTLISYGAKIALPQASASCVIVHHKDRQMKIINGIAILLSAGLFAGAVHAQELTGTLKQIKATGMITLGARESATPFSYNLEGTQFVGYSYDIMMKVVERIKTELKSPNLQFKV